MSSSYNTCGMDWCFHIMVAYICENFLLLRHEVHRLTVMFFIPDSSGGSHDNDDKLTVFRGHSIPPTVITMMSHGSKLHGTSLPY